MEDARDDRIASRRVGLEDFARRPAPFEDRPERRAVADLRGHFHHAERCRVAAWAIADAELRSGDGKLCKREAIFHQREALIRNADDDEWLRRGKCSKKQSKCAAHRHGKKLKSWHVP